MERPPKQQLETILLIDLRLEQLRRVQKAITAESELAVQEIKRVQERIQQVEKRVKRQGWIF